MVSVIGIRNMPHALGASLALLLMYKLGIAAIDRFAIGVSHDSILRPIRRPASRAIYARVINYVLGARCALHNLAFVHSIVCCYRLGVPSANRAILARPIHWTLGGCIALNLVHFLTNPGHVASIFLHLLEAAFTHNVTAFARFTCGIESLDVVVA
jgi:hypothetical protein